MTLPSFGIPEQQVKMQALEQVIGANQDALQQIALGAVAPISQTITDNEVSLNAIGSALRRKLGARIAQNTKQLNKPYQAAVGQLTAMVGANQSALAGLQSSQPPAAAESANSWCWLTHYDSCIVTTVFGASIGAGSGWNQNGKPGDVCAWGCGFATQADAQNAGDTWKNTHPNACDFPNISPPCDAGPPLPLPVSQPPLPPPALPEPPPPPPSTAVSPPPPEPSPPMPKPAIQCDAVCSDLSMQQISRYVIGGSKWCGDFESLRTAFVSIGNAALQYLEENLTGIPSNVGRKLAEQFTPPPGVPITFVPGATGLIQQFDDMLVAGGDFLTCSLRGQINCLKALVTASGACNPAEYIALVVFRSLLELLHNTRLGCDLAVWATVDYSLSLGEIVEVVNYFINASCPSQIPGIGETLECIRQGTISDEQANCWLAARGASRDVWQAVLDSGRDKLHPKELIQYARRTGQTDDQAIEALRGQGWTRPMEATAFVYLYDELPTISDHLHWLQRNVFDDSYVEQYQLMDGFDTRFWPKFGGDLRALGMKEDYARLHYAAHWITMPIGQMQEMTFRLRPDKPGVQNQFTPEDFQRLLAEQDIAPYFRPRLEEIRNKIPALGYLRDMYRANMLSDDEMKSYHRDLGYSETDSTLFVKIDGIQRSRMRVSGGHGWNPSAMGKAYAIGAMSQGDLEGRMQQQGYTVDEATDLRSRAVAEYNYSIIIRARSRAMMSQVTAVKDAIKVGVMSADDAARSLVALGWPQQFAQGLADATQVSANVDLVKQAIRKLKSAYLAGEIDDTYVVQNANGLGLLPDAIGRYLIAWKLQNTPNSKRRTATQIEADVASGNLSEAEAWVRLHNLGYEDADSRLFLVDAQAKIRSQQAKQTANRVRQERLQAKALDQAKKDAERQQSRIIAELKRVSPPAKLQKWAELGMVSWNEFHSRLSSFGTPEENITMLWREACARKTANCQTNGAPPPIS